MATLAHFRPERLPPPRQFYTELIRMRPNRKGWVQTSCPFHASQSRRSFSININTGGFHCFGCDARGGDIVAFVMLRDHCDFPAACRTLGAWDEAGQPAPRSPKVLRAFLWIDLVIDGHPYRSDILLDLPTNDRQLLHRIKAEALDRLREFQYGAREQFAGEIETQWSIAADAWTLIQDQIQ